MDNFRVVLIVCAFGCGKVAAPPPTTPTCDTAGQFTQSTTADFTTNVNTGVVTYMDQIRLGDDLQTGSGGDGDLTVSANMSLPGATYQYTSVTIAAGVTLTITGTTPLVIESSGPVMIAGTIDASGMGGGSGTPTGTAFGSGGAGGPGGSRGGDGILIGSPSNGNVGLGTGGGGAGIGWSGGGGGGHAVAGAASGASNGGGIAGVTYGSAMLTTLEGGSGGGGGSGGKACGSGGGGGGGGMIRIDAPSIAIATGGVIRADGGAGGSDGARNCGGGGGGSGGSIVLRTRDLTVAGTVSAAGGLGGQSTEAGAPDYGVGGGGAVGRLRFDAETSDLTAGTVTPAPGAQGQPQLATMGTTVTAPITATDLCAWGVLTYTVDQPAGSTIEIDVLDATGAMLVPNVASGTDLDSMVPATTSIMLQAQLSSNGQATPTLEDWTVDFDTSD